MMHSALDSDLQWLGVRAFLRVKARLAALSRVSIFLIIAASCANAQDYNAYTVKLQKNLNDNILAFWMPRCLDTKSGGYIINFDASGKPNGKTNKMIVTQSRMVWFFSRLARDGYQPEKMLAAADLGYRFLRDKMWDSKNGGFYWEVDATGSKHIGPNKHLYGQSFALYALSEYATASRKKEPLQLATKLFELLEAKAHDAKYGGYLESFREDWTPFESGASSYMGPVQFKLMNTHLHLLESITAYYRASQSQIARERLLELIQIESNTVVRKGISGCTDKYERNWSPVLAGNFARVSYGHDLENIWLLIDACKAAQISTYPFLDLYKHIFDNSQRYGFDREKGGFFDSGPFLKPADARIKTWWVQAEALVSSLYMYRITKDPKYWDVFVKTYEFVDKHQTDWNVGEWYETVTEDGKGLGDKAQIWKAGYHNGRAMLESLAVLRDLP
jgi:mannobiose 2-epimerase